MGLGQRRQRVVGRRPPVDDPVANVAERAGEPPGVLRLPGGQGGAEVRERVARRELEMLAEVPLFSSCGQAELRQIARLGTPVTVPAGRVLTVEGTPGREFFLVVEGAAECTIGGRHAAQFGPGDFFGEMALLDGGPRTATVTAATDMEVLVLDAREFASLLAASPSITTKVLATLARRLRAADAARTL